MTTTEFQRAAETILGIKLTSEQSEDAMRQLTTAYRRAADVIVEWSKSARGSAVLKAMKGQERYERKMKRQRARSSTDRVYENENLRHMQTAETISCVHAKPLQARRPEPLVSSVPCPPPAAPLQVPPAVFSQEGTTTQAGAGGICKSSENETVRGLRKDIPAIRDGLRSLPGKEEVFGISGRGDWQLLNDSRRDPKVRCRLCELSSRKNVRPPNPRIAYDLQRLREKRAADIERGLREQARRTRVMTSLPVEPPQLIPVASQADFDREMDSVVPGAEQKP